MKIPFSVSHNRNITSLKTWCFKYGNIEEERVATLCSKSQKLNFAGVGEWQYANEINYLRETDNKIRSGYNATMISIYQKCDSWGSYSDKGLHLMSN